MEKLDEFWNFTKNTCNTFRKKLAPVVKKGQTQGRIYTQKLTEKLRDLTDFKGRKQALYNSWDELAKEGNTEAAYKLVMLYFDESPEYYPLAFKWAYEMAHRGEDCGIMLQLAKMYEEGAGTEKNLKQALTWYERSLSLHIIRGKKSPLSVDSANFVQERIQVLRKEVYPEN